MNNKNLNKSLSWVEDIREISKWNLSSTVRNDLQNFDVKKVRIEITAIDDSLKVLSGLDSKKVKRIKKLQSIDDKRLADFFLSKGSIKKITL